MKIGLISFAHLHAYSYASQLKTLPGAEFGGIYDELSARARLQAANFGVPWFGRLEDLLAAVDAVIVTSANARHYDYTLAAAAAGRHVLCEKPLATAVEHAEQMVRRCAEAGVQLMTAFPMRFSPPVATAKRAVEAGAVGAVRAITGSNNGKMPAGWFSDPQLAGGGALMDHVVHLADIMHWLLGQQPEEVYAEADTLLHEGIEVEDVGMVLLRFRDGVIGTIDASWSRPESYPTWGGLRFRVVGADGVLDVDAFAQQEQVYSTAGRPQRWVYWGSGADRAMLAAFVEAIRAGRQVPVTGEDGLAAVRVAVAAMRSARSGKPQRLVA